jgi:hypothetical protein
VPRNGCPDLIDAVVESNVDEPRMVVHGLDGGT